MKLRSTICAIVLSIVAVFSLPASAAETTDDRLPNFVIIFIDDMGYSDIEPFGSEGIETPNLNKMAQQGMKFTDFQVSSAVCSASRAALLTGCYHKRISVDGAIMPEQIRGLHPDEVTIAELCKRKGYATACFGKWHLGHYPEFMPNRQGFDEFFGLPYSNDMWPNNPGANDPNLSVHKRKFPNLPLYENGNVINDNLKGEDQAQLTTQYTEKAVDFIKRNKDQPFLLYLPHSMVHVPLYVSDKFKGKSQRGLYGDVVMELDWSVGEINKTLEACGVAENTMVVFTSDNGPWLNYGDHAGQAKPLREGKGTMFEGGCRVPTLMKWPDTIPAGSQCDQLLSSIDLYPTIAKRIGVELPDRKIDGVDMLAVLKDPTAEIDRRYFFHYIGGGELHAVRDQRWKLHFNHKYRTLGDRAGGKDGIPVRYAQGQISVSLYDLQNDVGETKDVQAQHPEVVERLKKAANLCRVELGDRLTGKKGEGIRPQGFHKAKSSSDPTAGK